MCDKNCGRTNIELEMKDRVARRLWALLFVGGIGLWSCGGKKITVQKTPPSSTIYPWRDNELLVGFPKYSKPWIVFASREAGSVYASPKDEQADKKALFFDPFVVLKKRGDRYKVIKYEAGSIVNGQVDKARLKTQGWMREKDLLLWSESLRSATSGFRLKGLLTLQDPDVITHSEDFVQNDSITLFQDPSLLHPSIGKMPINAVVYPYMFTADQKRVLIGENPKIDADQLDPKQYGWVDARILSIWGERTAFRIKSTPGMPAVQLGLGNPKGAAAFTPVISSAEVEDINDLYHLYPLTYHWSKDDFEIRYWDHFLNYTENSIFNVDGASISYATYKKMVEEQRKLNVVFVLDGSQEVMRHASSFKAMIQGLATQFDPQSHFDSISYSTLFYQVDPAIKQQYEVQMKDFATWANSFERPMDFQETTATKTTLYESIEDLKNLLQSREYQSNLVVIVGETIQAEDREKQQDIIAKIVDTHCRLLFYQVQANYRDPYNDFVLFAEDVLKTSSDQLVPYKKQQLIHHENVVETNEFDLSRGNEGVYQLNYPLQSMHQGAVIFPKKGDVNTPFLLQKTLQAITQSIVVDNQKIDSTLTAAFRSDQGMSRTKIKPMYLPFFPQEQRYVSQAIARLLGDQTYVYLQKGRLKKQEGAESNVLEYGVLLDEDELEQLRDYYLSIYAGVFKNKKVSNRQMIRNYIQVARDKSVLPKKLKRRFLLDNTLFLGLFQQTGLYEIPLDSLSNLQLKKWRQSRWMNAKMLEDFFASFKTKASEIEEHKGDKSVRFQQHSQTFYWLNTTYLPLLNYSTGKRKDQAFDFLPVEHEKIKEQLPKNEINEGHAKDYIERVKRGMP